MRNKMKEKAKKIFIFYLLFRLHILFFEYRNEFSPYYILVYLKTRIV